MAKIPVRYIGGHSVILKDPGSVYGLDGKPVTSGLLEHGALILMEDVEVLGQTLLEEVRGAGLLRFLGAGRVILPEHQNVPADQLEQHGYQFHAGRTDFEPYQEPEPSQDPVPVENKPAKTQKTSTATV
jgi:hypothetical protein